MKLGMVVALLAACGNSSSGGDDLLAAKRAEMAAKIAPVVKASGANPPVLTTDGVTGTQGPFIAFPAGNTAIISETYLKELRQGGEDTTMLHQKTHAGVDMYPIEIFGSIFFGQLAGWVTDNHNTNFNPYPGYIDSKRAQRLIDTWNNLKYVIVMRVVELVKPETMTESTFKPGHMRIEALVYDTTGAPHGGFHYDTSSDKEITASKGDIDKAFAADMDAMQKLAFDKALAKIAPGSTKMEDFVLADFK